MTVTFKQFATYLAAPSDSSKEQLDEIWKSIFAKKDAEEDDDKAPKTRQELDAKRKEMAEKRKKDLQDKRDKAWNDAKDRIEGRKQEKKSGPGYHRDDVTWHNSMSEGKESYSSESYWKDDAKAAGYKVKKLSGNIEDGDQTWGAFKDDKKMGEFTEVEDGRGGWLITE